VPERLHVAPGEAIALYTDGVTETDRSAPLTAAELAAALPPGAGHGDAAALADAVVDLATQRAPHGELRDDIAVLALRAR
jgi:serine phosphatase RsbU (regulator of sigma subunit)